MTAAAYRIPEHRYDALDLRADAHLLDLRNRAIPAESATDPHGPYAALMRRAQGERVHAQGAPTSVPAYVVREETTLGNILDRRQSE